MYVHVYTCVRVSHTQAYLAHSGMYTHTYTCTHACVSYTLRHVHTYVHVYTCVRVAHTQACTHVRTCVHMRACSTHSGLYTCTYTCTHACVPHTLRPVHMYVHVYTCVRVAHTYVRVAHTQACTHIRTCVQMRLTRSGTNHVRGTCE